MRNLELRILCLILTLSFQVKGQNLVPNPSFEDFFHCPTGISGIAYSPTYTSFPTAKAWVSPLNLSSPDYFNSCAAPMNGAGVQVPKNIFGYQKAHTGNGYAGINAYEGHYKNGNLTLDYREYIQTKLSKPLQAGKRYCVSFYISPSIEPSLDFNFVAIDQVGVNFSNTQKTSVTDYTLNLQYDVRSIQGQLFTDTSAWIKVYGTFIAKGGEEWLTLGSFTGGGTINKQQAYPIPANPSFDKERAYLYIDDVSVYQISNGDTTRSTIDSSFCIRTAIPMRLYSSAPEAATYLWSIGENTRDIVVSATGTYWCIAKTDCQVFIDTFIVEFKPDSKLEFKNNYVSCGNEPLEIKAEKVFDSYLWSTGATTQAITVTKSGDYILTGTNRCGVQTDTAHVFIQAPTDPPIVSDTIICQFTKDPVLVVKGSELTWYFNATTAFGLPVQPQLITREIDTFTMYVTQKIGECESPRASFTVEIKYQPRHVLDNKAVMCIDSIQLIGKHVSSDVTYKWSNGQSGCCILPMYEGIHRVAITSPYCGTYIDSTQVVFSLCDTCLVLPNAFSPNRDGLNDKYLPIPICGITDYHIAIYNRWGQKVFESFNVSDGWDGRFNGELQADGVYIYTIEYRSASTKIGKVNRGNITLLR